MEQIARKHVEAYLKDKNRDLGTRAIVAVLYLIWAELHKTRKGHR